MADYDEEFEIMAEAAELMADEALYAMEFQVPYEAIEPMKDYLHAWAAKFRTGTDVW